MFGKGIKKEVGRFISMEQLPTTIHGHPTNMFLTLSVPQRNLAGWQKYRCADELAGKFIIDRGFGWELLTFSSILTRAGCRNSEDLSSWEISCVSCWEKGTDMSGTVNNALNRLVIVVMYDRK